MGPRPMKRAWTGEGSHVAEYDTWLVVVSCESPRQSTASMFEMW